MDTRPVGTFRDTRLRIEFAVSVDRITTATPTGLSELQKETTEIIIGLPRLVRCNVFEYLVRNLSPSVISIERDRRRHPNRFVKLNFHWGNGATLPTIQSIKASIIRMHQHRAREPDHEKQRSPSCRTYVLLDTGLGCHRCLVARAGSPTPSLNCGQGSNSDSNVARCFRLTGSPMRQTGVFKTAQLSTQVALRSQAAMQVPLRQLYIAIIVRPSVSGLVGHTRTASLPSNSSSKLMVICRCEKPRAWF